MTYAKKHLVSINHFNYHIDKKTIS